jgi:molybdopterin converting factor small subunit
MHDVHREKFANLMNEVEELEDKIEANDSKEDISALREELIEKRNELQRLSDGCGVAHHH